MMHFYRSHIILISIARSNRWTYDKIFLMDSGAVVLIGTYSKNKIYVWNIEDVKHQMYQKSWESLYKNDTLCYRAGWRCDWHGWICEWEFIVEEVILQGTVEVYGHFMCVADGGIVIIIAGIRNWQSNQSLERATHSAQQEGDVCARGRLWANYM